MVWAVQVDQRVQRGRMQQRMARRAFHAVIHQDTAFLRRVSRRVQLHLFNKVIRGDGPESRAMGLGMPHDRRLFPHCREGIECIAAIVRENGGGCQVHGWFQVIHGLAVRRDGRLLDLIGFGDVLESHIQSSFDCFLRAAVRLVSRANLAGRTRTCSGPVSISVRPRSSP